MIKNLYIFLIAFFLINFVFGQNQVIIKQIKGEVKIRKGLSENWEKATLNIPLDEMDTILSGEDSKVVLQLPDGNRFILQENAILDIGDLKKISQDELFFFLMSNKIDNIKPRNEKTPLRIGNVSVIHGTSKTEEKPGSKNPQEQMLWVKEKNGAVSLFNQDYYSNTIVKLYKLLNRFGEVNDCGEIHFYLAKSFEETNQQGMARNAWQKVIDEYNAGSCADELSRQRYTEAQAALLKLK